MITFATKAYKFFTTLRLDSKLPKGIEVMNPYREAEVRACFKSFLHKYYDDKRGRILIFGINPGRFGAGLTGIAFTDPVALQEFCSVPNDLKKVREPSSRFVYEVIARWGGVKKFNRDFFLTATCPLGFTKGGINYNFYDHAQLQRAVTPFIVRNIMAHLAMGGRRDVAIVLGTGKLKTYFERLNAEHGYFDRVIALEHPRFILQYRRKRMAEFIERYQTALAYALRIGRN